MRGSNLILFFQINIVNSDIHGFNSKRIPCSRGCLRGLVLTKWVRLYITHIRRLPTVLACSPRYQRSCGGNTLWLLTEASTMILKPPLQRKQLLLGNREYGEMLRFLKPTITDFSETPSWRAIRLRLSRHGNGSAANSAWRSSSWLSV